MELAERPVSKNASVSFFVCARQKGIMEITAETVETWDKASDLTDNIFRTYGPPCVKKFRNLGMVPKISQ